MGGDGIIDLKFKKLDEFSRG
ncbi:hypothetical protein, partial [uncultured Gammaproteobacteria bacterium]